MKESHEKQPDVLTSEQLQRIEKTTLVIPHNDGESVMIGEIAQHFAFDVRVIEGEWNRPQEKREEQMRAMEDIRGEIIAVELRAPEVEREWIAAGHSFRYIDHHTYGNEVRSPVKKNSPSSLEQFLVFFGITDEQLEKTGFKYPARFVRGVAVNDALYIRGLVHEGYSLQEIEEIRRFDRDGQYQDAEIVATNEEAFRCAEELAPDVWSLEFKKNVNYTLAQDKVFLGKIERDGLDVDKVNDLQLIISRPLEDDRFRLVYDGHEVVATELSRRFGSSLVDRGEKRWITEVDVTKLEEIKDYLRS